MEVAERFAKPTKVDAIDVAFGGGGKTLRELMPSYAEIPDEFKRQSNRWVKFQQDWFFNGLKKEEIPKAKDGIDQGIALSHLQCIQGSFEPKHEHKEAAVAYLASLWFH